MDKGKPGEVEQDLVKVKFAGRGRNVTEMTKSRLGWKLNVELMSQCLQVIKLQELN